MNKLMLFNQLIIIYSFIDKYFHMDEKKRKTNHDFHHSHLNFKDMAMEIDNDIDVCLITIIIMMNNFFISNQTIGFEQKNNQVNDWTNWEQKDKRWLKNIKVYEPIKLSFVQPKRVERLILWWFALTGNIYEQTKLMDPILYGKRL